MLFVEAIRFKSVESPLLHRFSLGFFVTAHRFSTLRTPSAQRSRQKGLLSEETRRERLKSALYLRLKKRKVFKIVKGGTLWAF